MASKIRLEILGALSFNPYGRGFYLSVYWQWIVCIFLLNYERWWIVLLICLSVIRIFLGLLWDSYVLKALNTWNPVEWIFAGWTCIFVCFLTDFVKDVAYGTAECQLVFCKSNFFYLNFVLKCINLYFEFALRIALVKKDAIWLTFYRHWDVLWHFVQINTAAHSLFKG